MAQEESSSDYTVFCDWERAVPGARARTYIPLTDALQQQWDSIPDRTSYVSALRAVVASQRRVSTRQRLARDSARASTEACTALRLARGAADTKAEEQAANVVVRRQTVLEGDLSSFLQAQRTLLEDLRRLLDQQLHANDNGETNSSAQSIAYTTELIRDLETEVPRTERQLRDCSAMLSRLVPPTTASGEPKNKSASINGEPDTSNQPDQRDQRRPSVARSGHSAAAPTTDLPNDHDPEDLYGSTPSPVRRDQLAAREERLRREAEDASEDIASERIPTDSLRSYEYYERQERDLNHDFDTQQHGEGDDERISDDESGDEGDEAGRDENGLVGTTDMQYHSYGRSQFNRLSTSNRWLPNNGRAAGGGRVGAPGAPGEPSAGGSNSNDSRTNSKRNRSRDREAANRNNRRRRSSGERSRPSRGNEQQGADRIGAEASTREQQRQELHELWAHLLRSLQERSVSGARYNKWVNLANIDEDLHIWSNGTVAIWPPQDLDWTSEAELDELYNGLKMQINQARRPFLDAQWNRRIHVVSANRDDPNASNNAAYLRRVKQADMAGIDQGLSPIGPPDRLPSPLELATRYGFDGAAAGLQGRWYYQDPIGKGGFGNAALWVQYDSNGKIAQECASVCSQPSHDPC